METRAANFFLDGCIASRTPPCRPTQTASPLTRRTRPQPAAAPANCRWQGRANHDCCGHATQWPPSSSRGARSVHGSSHPYRSGRWQPTSLVGIHVEEVDVACTLADIIKVRQDSVHHHLTNQRVWILFLLLSF